ncbi:MAG: DUF938 domain-containing protein [Chromatiales bacterium]|nr:DUF938 domain-containing protein [Gammaproteobacteria bacterium]MBW6477339.1 DUF938 domain-containing protein [Chromatiales bacterium]
MKPFSQSCVDNLAPIRTMLRQLLRGRQCLLEIGSGTGQHAAALAGEFPTLLWQTSDCAPYHAGIRAWLAEAPANALPPLALDVGHQPWPVTPNSMDAVFSANTAHIMSWPEVEAMFEGVGQVLVDQGLFALYGPFNYRGRYTTEGNARFDQWLKARDPASGIRDRDAVNALAEGQGLRLYRDFAMPANNRMLVWLRRQEQ